MGPEYTENLDEFEFAAGRKVVRLGHDVEIGIEIKDLNSRESNEDIFEMEDKRTE